MKEFVFETYEEMLNFLLNSNKMDVIIIEAAKKIVDNSELEMDIAKIRCVEINKYADIKLTYEDLSDTLNKIIERRIKEEDYESCHDIKIMLDKITKNTK